MTNEFDKCFVFYKDDLTDESLCLTAKSAELRNGDVFYLTEDGEGYVPARYVIRIEPRPQRDTTIENG